MAILHKICVIFCMVKCIESANILYVIPFTSPSHYVLLRPIGIELARRGHNVTVITANKEKKPLPNYREVMVDDKKIWEVLKTERPNIFTMVDLSAEEFHHEILWKGGLAFTEVALNSTPVKDFLKETHSFDVMIAEQFYQEAFYALSYKYNAPLVLITTFGNCMRHNIITANPLQLATIIPEFLDIKSTLTFWGRLRGAYFTIYEYIWWRFYYLKKHEIALEKYQPELAVAAPSLYEIQKNASLILINRHFSYEIPMALLPNIIEVGGLHLSNSKLSLAQDLQVLLDEAKYGVVYVNFGSNVRSVELPDDKKNAFLNVFRKLKHTVLWKWEDEEMEGKPNNVVLRKWFPQKEILAHPNIKVFISHGGLIGTQEAIYNGIPIIGIPIYADQYNNLLDAEQGGYGRILQYHDINEENLKTALHGVLSNDVMLKKAKEISERFKDRPMTPLDTAIFWIEYVIRHKGADFIKNPARNMSSFAYNMIDVYLFLLMSSFGLLSLFIVLTRFLVRLFYKVLVIKMKEKHQ